MRAIRSCIAIASAALATSLAVPASAQVGDLKALTACTPGRAWIWSGTAFEPASVLGDGTVAGKCKVLVDEALTWGPVDATMTAISHDQAPEAPDRRAIAIGGLPTIDRALEIELHGLAEQSHWNARIYLSRFLINFADSTVVARICNPNWDSLICKRANEQFHSSVAANNRAIDQRNARLDAEARQARASSEPVNSGYYSSGASSTSAPYRPSSGASTTGTPVQGVQSESEIRKDQARCRAGSGPC
jgi:hypothetical protein